MPTGSTPSCRIHWGLRWATFGLFEGYVLGGIAGRARRLFARVGAETGQTPIPCSALMFTHTEPCILFVGDNIDTIDELSQHGRRLQRRRSGEWAR